MATSKRIKAEEDTYEAIFSDANTIIETRSLWEIINDINEGYIKDDMSIQRDDGQLPLKDQSLIVHTVLVNLSINPISMAQQGTGAGIVRLLIDGKQRTSTLNRYRNDEFKLAAATPPIRMRRTVMVPKLDENGEPIKEKAPGESRAHVVMVPKLDENGNPVKEEFSYKVAGKKFSELPKCLRRQFDAYKNMPQYVHVNYTPDEIQLQMLRDNTSAKMNPVQVGVVVCGEELAEWLKSFKKHDIITNCSTWAKNDEKKDSIIRAIIESFVLTICDDWKDKYNNNLKLFVDNSTERYLEAFTNIMDDMAATLNPYSEVLAQHINKKNFHIIAAAFCHFCDLQTRYNKTDFGKFLCKWFSEIKATTKYETDGNQGSKQRGYINHKLNIINAECEKFMERYGTEYEPSESEVEDSKKEEVKESFNINYHNPISDGFANIISDKKWFDIVSLMVSSGYHYGNFDVDTIGKFGEYYNALSDEYKATIIDSAEFNTECLYDYLAEIPNDSKFITEDNLLCLLNVFKRYVCEDNIEDDVFVEWLKDFAGEYKENSVYANISQDQDNYIMGRISYLYNNLEKYNIKIQEGENEK